MKFAKEGINRPITLQTHVDPVPHFIVSNCLKNMGRTKQELHDFLTKDKAGKKKKGNNREKGK